MSDPAAARRERARTSEQKEQLRDQILREALALFVEDGYAGFTLRKLARRLRMTAPALYAYYRNKDQLLLGVVSEGYELLGAYLVAARGNPVDRPGAIGRAILDFAFRNPQLYTLMFIQRPGALFDTAPAAVQARLGLLQGLAKILGDAPGLAGRSDEERLRMAELFWALHHGLVSLSLTMPVFDEAWARRNLAFLTQQLRPLLAGAPA